jgi:hypothetical protein
MSGTPGPTMTTVGPITQISHIRSLRKELRDATLPISTVKALELIHGYLKTGTDQQGWRRVDFKPRNGGGGGGGRAMTFERRAAGGAGASSSATIMPNTPPVRYVSKFKSAAPEKVDETILNTIILGKLNKFSYSNYNEIKDFLCQILDSGQTDFLKHFMLLVFQKAAAEEFFCPLYAKLLSELSSKYTILHSEMETLYGQFMSIFEEIDESSAADYNDFVKRTEQKKYRLGYSQFLAELIKHGTVNIELFMKTLTTIIKQISITVSKHDSVCIIEEYVDCMKRIVKAIKECRSTECIAAIRLKIKSEICMIEPYTKKNPDFISLSNKARFAFMDIYEMGQKF